MQTHPPSSQPDTVSYSGLGCLSPPFTALRAPLVDVQPEGDGVLLHRVQYNHQPPLDIDHSHAAGLGTLVDLAHRLKPLLAPGYRWLGQEDLSVAGARPIDAGGFADVWVGEMDDRKVAVKSYRCYESADHMPTYNRFCHEALTCTHLSGECMVPFIGVYSTQDHPFALVFEFMEHLNLREYLRNNCEVGRLDSLLGVARAMEDMHNLNVVYGNLKITNVLVGADGHIRIAGLGAASIPSNPPPVSFNSFFHGAAPELADPQRFQLTDSGVTAASDVYAFGVLAWEVFAGRVPFPGRSKVAGVYSMLRGRRPGRPDHPELSDRVWRTIQGCWKGNPARRKTITQVVAILRAELNKVK